MNFPYRGNGLIPPWRERQKAQEETMTDQRPFAAEMPWPDFHARVKDGKTPILIPLGSMEQHGHHMPLHVDVLLPTEFSSRVAARIGGLVSPTFNYGYKSQQKCGGGNHMPGTISLEGQTLVHQLRDVIKEFARHGGRNFSIVNGHFENSWFIHEAVDLALRELRWDGIENVKIVVLSYWDFVNQETIDIIYPDGFPGWAVEHGGVLETSLMLALYPDLVHLERAVDHPPATFPPYDVYPVKKEWTPDSGTLSSPKHASREKGELMLSVCTDGIVKALRDEFSIN
jgi:creatinine amidohydrolase